ncbi:hypothetical protein CNMCM8980_009419 [Aspergillus fumigatiaffinis]|uniref:Uncharacterized protein n=1 Tax=Aspergillus fumigatiaffinis TaxID=340414 RepID=A0A8H4GLN1_9EURO|nr:hypothetical protein CNMCM5878_001094 [Aspergillus fumigatiaffinis]KAF4224328.1 hypothetical protein CNMCM6457_009555 [Aspergillus fumigatiaffinis]KAF4232965.1 hypothetical protein CNMCM6805_009588 [Aspergillus fumigatiaffinis]KAF4245733.1 hypothetical protein CNMCM8980_009419 [Aspergillus fumigatiaffinis]
MPALVEFEYDWIVPVLFVAWDWQHPVLKWEPPTVLGSPLLLASCPLGNRVRISSHAKQLIMKLIKHGANWDEDQFLGFLVFARLLRWLAIVLGSANNPAPVNPPPPPSNTANTTAHTTADTAPRATHCTSGRPRPKKRRARPPTKGAQQAASPARVVAVGSTLQGTQACTLSRAYATEVDAALAAAIRRPLTAGTTSKEGFCPYTCASSVLLCFLLFFALRRQAHRPDGWEGALVAQTCVASCTWYNENGVLLHLLQQGPLLESKASQRGPRRP